MVKFFEGSVQDWHNHWRRRHGLDEASLKGFYKDISELEGHVEDVCSLADLPEGWRGTVAFAVGGHGLVRRLGDMGLTPGTEVKVLRAAPFHGPVEVSVRGVSLALGRGVASKVFVKAAGREAN
ncbi:ferrous iron transport protein A [Candidatus Bathyarchaeota archaeon]|nr:ferrous iron transport protein A [Candidatus Bathyarchaeota archaeon]